MTEDEPLWFDAHAHPGRCFLRGLPEDDPFVKLTGGDRSEDAIGQMRGSRVRLAAFASVGDLRVLGVTPDGGLHATRAFEPGEAFADHERQLVALNDLASGEGRALIRSPSDVARALETDQIGVMITCEGADFLEGRLERVEAAFDAGARSLTLVHYRINEIGDIQTEDPKHGGLTNFGGEVVREMNRIGMIIDLAHATEAVTRDVVDASSQPVLISHSHLDRMGSGHPRLLSPDHALVVANSGGVVAAWPSGVVCESLSDYVDEIMRLIDLLGVDHVAIGTDMDANFRPVVDRYDQFTDVAGALRAKALSDAEVSQVMGGNLVRLFEAVYRSH